MLWLRIWALVLCIALGGAGAAAAACRPADLAGTWDLYMTVGDDVFAAAWVACVFRIALNGAILAGGQCIDYVGDRARIGGRMVPSPSCSALGQLTLGIGFNAARVQVPQATLSREKSLLFGVTVANNTGIPSIFQAVKRGPSGAGVPPGVGRSGGRAKAGGQQKAQGS